MQKRFSISEAVKFGFETTKKNLLFFVLLVLIIAAFSYTPGFITERLPKENWYIILLVSIVFWIVNALIQAGEIKIALKFIDGKKGEFSDLFSQSPILLNYIAGSILYGLIVFAGLLLLVVPGIIWAIKLQFFGYLIVDKGMGPIEALKASWEITKGVKMQLFLLALANIGVIILGVLALVIGLFVAIPTTVLASAYVFRKLSKS